MQMRAAMLIPFVLAPSLHAADPGFDPAMHPVTRRTIRSGFQPAGAGAVPIAFFDADSTLRVARSGSVSASSPRDVVILPGVAGTLARISAEGYLVAIVSNQGGIPKFVSLADADAALKYTIHLLNARGAPVDYYDFAEKDDGLRKPRTGMGELLEQVLRVSTGRSVDWARTVMVGDSAWKKGHDKDPHGRPGSDFSNSDRLFAENLGKAKGGVTFHDPADYFGWSRFGVTRFNSAADVNRFYDEHPDLEKKQTAPTPDGERAGAETGGVEPRPGGPR